MVGDLRGMSDQRLYFGDFEILGEEAVRHNLTAGRYNEKKAPWAREWLRQQEQARADAVDAEARDLARRNTASAESDTRTLREANRIALGAASRATWALWVAGGSLVVAVLALALGR